jgi:hypothetical protein
VTAGISEIVVMSGVAFQLVVSDLATAGDLIGDVPAARPVALNLWSIALLPPVDHRHFERRRQQAVHAAPRIPGPAFLHCHGVLLKRRGSPGAASTPHRRTRQGRSISSGNNLDRAASREQI